MNNKDFKNFQNSLYSNIPPENLKHSRSEGFGTHKSLNHTPDLSDSEHTQSSQTRSDERFRMTEECHPEEFSSRHPEASAEGSMYILDSCQRLKQGSKNTICHPEERSELRILPVINDCQEHWSDSEHTQSLQTCKDGRFRMTLLRSVQTAALTLALSFFITAPAMAADTPPVPASAQTDNSAYTLTKVEQTGTNVITKYEWWDTENKLVPQYYQVNLNKTEYGYPDVADETKTFTVTTPNADGSGNAFEYEIKYYVDSSRLAPGKINADQSGADIDKDFVGIYETYWLDGGAIHSNGNEKIGDITGDFISNCVLFSNASARGGAIYNSGIIEDITGDFIGNYASANDYTASGGAINSNSGTIGDITGDFIGNYASGDSALGGAIYNNNGTIGNITGDFIGNYASANDYTASGGAIGNGGTIGDITGDFIGNYVSSCDSEAAGGAIINGGTIGDVTGDFIGNYAVSDSSYATGGAIANLGYIGTPDEQTGAITEGEIKNSSFIGNYAESKTGNAAGGAIFSTNNINIVADNGQSIFSGNKTISNGKEEQNAIGMYGVGMQDPSSGKFVFMDPISGDEVDKNTANLKLEAKNNGIIVFDDTIRGGAVDYEALDNQRLEVIETHETAFDLKVTGDSTGKVILNNDVINANISLDNTNLYLGREDVFDKSVSLSFNSGSIYLNNQSIGTMHVPTLNLNGNTNISVDADLANKSMDRITADNYNVKDGAMLNVNNVVLLSDASQVLLLSHILLSGNTMYLTRKILKTT